MRSDLLTDREAEVWRLVRTGQTNGAIGLTLCISPRTVENHIGAVCKKLGVSTRAAALWALRNVRRTYPREDPKTIMRKIIHTTEHAALPGGHGSRPFFALHLACGHVVTRRQCDLNRRPNPRRARCPHCTGVEPHARNHQLPAVSAACIIAPGGATSMTCTVPQEADR